MHLLNIQDGEISDGAEPVDLAQDPGDLVVISAADTDLSGLEAACGELGDEFPSLRLANLMTLQHNFSVDLYVQKVISHARFVCVRVLGGKTYWPYGVSEIVQACRKNGAKLAMIPGDSKPDFDLEGLSNIADADRQQLWDYLQEGGRSNLRSFLRHAAWLIGQADSPAPPAVPLPNVGLYWPNGAPDSLEELKCSWKADRPVALIIFYRAFYLAGSLQALDALIAGLQEQGLNPLPVFVQSLKQDAVADYIRQLIQDAVPDIVLNLTGFAVSTPGRKRTPSPLEAADCPILQCVLSAASEDEWQESLRGLTPRDIAMNVALPEVDGRILSRAIAFRQRAAQSELTQHAAMQHVPNASRISFVTELAEAWVKLRKTPEQERKVALILANYPNRDGRLANGVGLDTPASTIEVMKVLRGAGYDIEGEPQSASELMSHLTKGPTNDRTKALTQCGKFLSYDDYLTFFEALPEETRGKIEDRWGAPEKDPFFEDDHAEGPGFHLAIHSFGNVVAGIQPARGYQIDPEETYHSPDLPPPHGYLAFYAWLRRDFGAHAVVHLGKHGNLEWLPGKALSLSESCFPEAILGPLPHLYPFIVNDPGEGTQAKRRTSAVIIDHLTPPLTRAESYGPLRDLETLVDEYYEAAGVDARRLPLLRRAILDAAASAGLDREGLYDPANEDEAITALDNYLCELKEMQIRDGLHIFGVSPGNRLLTDLTIAIARAPRGHGEGEDASLLRAMSEDLGFDSFDPLDCRLGERWEGSRPDFLNALLEADWRTNGDTVERLELFASKIVEGEYDVQDDWSNMREVLDYVIGDLRPAIERCGQSELDGLLTTLDGRFLLPGSSGAPSRGRPDVLPTGKNFYSVDTRSVPTQTAWKLGFKSAQMLVDDYLQREGMWPKAMTLSAWGTSNMRTGGDDVAQALALMGVRPKWDLTSGRVTGFEILPTGFMGRPRVDVTFRVSGFFRDAFPEQMDLIDSAARAVMKLDESDEDNPLAKRFREERDTLRRNGHAEHLADLKAGARVYGSKPGAYGAGLQALIDESIWQDRSDLANAYLEWGSYAYGAGQEGDADRTGFERRIKASDAIVQNQDNREHDLLDSDDYYQFEGGLAAAAEHLKGVAPIIYHNDHSRPETPKVRTLDDEIARVVRARAVNPKWIKGVMRHGYKGAFEMAATLDYLFAFAAATNAGKSHQFDLLHEAYFEDSQVQDFIRENNPAALREMATRFLEALDRGLWQPRRNSTRSELQALLTFPDNPHLEDPA